MYDKDYVTKTINTNIEYLLSIEKDITTNGLRSNMIKLKKLGIVDFDNCKIIKNKNNMKTTTVKTNLNKTQEIQVGKIRKVDFSEISRMKSKKSIIDTSVLELKQGECRSFSGTNIEKVKTILYSYMNVLRKRVDLKSREYITRTEYDDNKKPTGVLIYRKK